MAACTLLILMILLYTFNNSIHLSRHLDSKNKCFLLIIKKCHVCPSELEVDKQETFYAFQTLQKYFSRLACSEKKNI